VLDIEKVWTYLGQIWWKLQNHHRCGAQSPAPHPSPSPRSAEQQKVRRNIHKM